MEKHELLGNFLFCIKEEPVLYWGNIKIEREVYPIYRKYLEEGLGDYQTPEDFFEAHYQEKKIPEVRNLVAEQTQPYQTNEFQDNIINQIVLATIASILAYFTIFPPLGEILLVLSLLEIIILIIFYLLFKMFPKIETLEKIEGTLLFFNFFLVIFASMVYFDFFPSLGEFFLMIWTIVFTFTIITNLFYLILLRKFSTSILTFFYMVFQILKLKEYLNDIIEPRYALILVLVAIGYILNMLNAIFG